MEPTVIATIIGVIGTGLLGMFGYFIHSVRGDIRALEEKFDKRFEKIEEKFDKRFEKIEERLGALEVTVAAMAATLEQHSELLHHMMGHGERITALEAAVFGHRAEGAVSDVSEQEPGGAAPTEPTTVHGPSTPEHQDTA